MTASTEERLAAIEEAIKHQTETMGLMRDEIRNRRYITPEFCEMQHKFYEGKFESMKREIDNVYKAINGVSARLEEMRKSWAGRLWAIALPVLGALAASLVALVYQTK